jgi:hypothetical protein
MTEANSTAQGRPDKPAQPYPDLAETRRPARLLAGLVPSGLGH